MLSILQEMEKPPFGFMPTSATALVLGFTLKEYANESYFWSNKLNNAPMTVDKMKTMIANALTERVNRDPKYREEFIVTMRPEIRAFLDCAVTAFSLNQAQCGSVEAVRDQLRIRMKSFSFPIWCVNDILDQETIETPRETISGLIDRFSLIVNVANGGSETESEIAAAIGRLALENPAVSSDLKKLMNSDHCRKGMLAYLKRYQDGKLVELAGEIGDGGAYLDEVRKRFSASDANWLWHRESADEKISDVILDYQIIKESNRSMSKCTTLRETVSGWNARTNQILIPCEAVAKLTGDLGPFLRQLAFMKQNNALLDQHRQAFYDLLLTQRESFEHFYKNQVRYFRQDAAAFLGELDEDEITQLYGTFPPGQFTKGKSEYYKFVQAEVDKFVQSQWKKKLRDLWQQKTGTKDPRDWSEQYGMPILCMFDGAERAAVRPLFQIVFSTNPSESDAKKAMEFLENADFYDRLASKEERDRCFMKHIVGAYQVLLADADRIRKELSQAALYDHPYDWMNNASVQSQIQKLATKEYKLTGCDRAMAVIDRMGTEQLREYLRERIMDDTDFGMQILKDQ